MIQSDIQIVPMQESDLLDVMDLQLCAFGQGFQEPYSLFHEMLTHSPHTHFMVRVGAVAAGYVFAHPAVSSRRDLETGCGVLTGAEDSLYIHDLSIHPDYQGRGIAKMLYQHVENAARALDIPILTGIAVQQSNSFWEKFGFSMEKPMLYLGEPGIFMMKELR